MNISTYFGPAATLMGSDYDAQERLVYTIRVDAGELVTTGGLSNDLEVDDLQSERIIVALLNCLYHNTTDNFNEIDYPIIGTSITPGRISLTDEGGQEALYETYDMIFTVRQPSSAGPYPDPESLY